MNLTVKDTAKRHHQKPLKPDFEDLYIVVRQQEKRVYTDEQLQNLPDIDSLHIYCNEWKIRKRSGERLIAYLQRKRRHLRILEVGCGNGWLSARLSGINDTKVIGLDINQVEISQASRVFKKDNLEFVYDTFNDNTFENQTFDVIVFAASLQYFPSVINVLKQAQSLLNPRGEIHIIDTPLYDPLEAYEADQRSRKYYETLGFSEMADYYYHHSISEFWGFKYRIMFNPGNIINRLFKKDPFYWISIRK
ncbi:MAG TPA: class I SAM-dependent methyltransferase [Mucilaginibacter sp.]|nr:class I SAM-dependent methyltransferase [Mucilaginibacter sp.]